MPYCVHCGVKLGAGEKKCPLCGVEVHDPLAEASANEARAYPVRTPEQELRHSKFFFLALSCIFFLLPAAGCAVIDLLTNGRLTWSVYPAAALMLLFIAVSVPILAHRFRTYISIVTNFVTLSAYLFMVERLSDTHGWFFPIALPALGLFTLLVGLTTALYRHHRLNKVTLLAVSFVFTGLECFAIETLCDLTLRHAVALSWSPYVTAPCLFVGLILFFINGNRTVREELRRRVHF